MRLALLAEGSHALAEVLAAEAGLAQLDQLPLEVLGELAGVGAQLADHALVPRQRQRRVVRDDATVPDLGDQLLLALFPLRYERGLNLL